MFAQSHTGSRVIPAALFWALALTCCSWRCGPVLAQSDLPKDQQAQVAAEIDLARLRSSPLGKVISPRDLLEDTPLGMGEFGGMDVEKFERVRIFVRLPESVTDMQFGMEEGDDLPMEFMVEVITSDASSFESFRETVVDDSEKDVVEGEDYWRPENGPGNVAAVFPADGKSFLVGTDAFLKNRKATVASDRLLDLWKPLPASILRLAADLEQSGDLMAEIQGFASMGAPAEMQPLVDALPEFNTLAVSLDLNSADLLKLAATGRTPESAEALRGLAEMLKGLFQQGAEQSRNGPPAMQGAARLMQEIADGSSIGEAANGATLSIKAPADFAGKIERDVMAGILAARTSVREFNDVKQVLISLHNYVDAYGQLPQAVASDPSGLSWRVHILPFLEEQALYENAALDEPWDSATNKKLGEMMPAILGQDGDGTKLCGVRHEKQPARFQDITDGTSNTIALVVMGEARPWTRNNDPTIDEVLAYVDSLDGEGSVVVGFYDGSVRTLPASTEPETLRAMLTPNGGEVVNF
jgi:Protein of unknown function (DUF1559)